MGMIKPLLKKGDPTNPDNYRGIALLNTIGKLYGAVLENKLRNAVDIPEDSNIKSTHILSIILYCDFSDLCKGGHIPHTGLVKAVKLTNVAGAYWKGN